MADMHPQSFRRWHLYGAGLEQVRLESVATPEPGPDELLVRHDGCGICYSDIKIINLGPDHPRLVGRNLAEDPVVMGHEVALTVDTVGAAMAERFQPGQRFIVQADVYYRGVNIAYGYALKGGMSPYGIVGPEVLDGDEGCYLLPISPDLGIVSAALVEPWACVEAAYRWTEETNHVFRLDESEPAGARPVDVGRVHYDGWRYVGPRSNTRADLKPGGVTWLLGSGGPMGQMHVQRTLCLPNPPRRLVVTDRNDHRIEALRERFAPMAADRGVELVLVNIRNGFEPTDYAPDGYDDIVVLVPDVGAIEQGWPLLADSGVLNVFAGLARGTMANLDLRDVVTKNVRVVGTSGSSIADMRAVLEKTEAKTLDTAASLAAIGGLEAFRDGLQGVKESRYPGKTVIFPNIEGLPLTALPDLASVRPDVAAHLRDGRYWTDAAERALLGG